MDEVRQVRGGKIMDGIESVDEDFIVDAVFNSLAAVIRSIKAFMCRIKALTFDHPRHTYPICMP